ncbi:hypothetical protein MTR66_14560 [Novosphingobium sp. 2638]|uniref:Uncharacterized protein n=2 Tax=Novosphingobium beihaiensis TaxID=2930389 RepID=A0ABT0BSL5_9SPHN|nr:hypothetical protein [Novosphingobium beihaiensis]
MALTAGIIGLTSPWTSCAAAKPISTFYYLPKVTASATVQQRIVTCSSDPQGIEVVTTWVLKASANPDYADPVELDASAGLFVDRTLDMKLSPEGMLKELNAKSANRTGEFITSVVKLAGTLAPMVAGLPPIPAPMPTLSASFVNENKKYPNPVPIKTSLCNDTTLKRLEQQRNLIEDITKLEDDITAGRAGAATIDQLARRRKALEAVHALLTLSASSDGLEKQFGSLTPCASKEHCKPSGSVNLRIASYDAWFTEAGSRPASIIGADKGFLVKWAASSDAASALASAPGVYNPPTDKEKSRQGRELIYLRPVPATLVVGPRLDAGDDFDPSPRARSASGSLNFVVPQLSPRFALPLGAGGIFGSRSVKGVFDGFGTPNELSYGSESGATAMASAADSFGNTVMGVHDAELTELKHLNDLHDAQEKYRTYMTSTN